MCLPRGRPWPLMPWQGTGQHTGALWTGRCTGPKLPTPVSSSQIQLTDQMSCACFPSSCRGGMGKEWGQEARRAALGKVKGKEQYKTP